MTRAPDPNDLFTPTDAARVLGLSVSSVRAVSNSGLLPSLRTVNGYRLFRRRDVERLAVERALYAAGGTRSAQASGGE
jgi:DNA-binding transcriptional MerR regulator